MSSRLRLNIAWSGREKSIVLQAKAIPRYCSACFQNSAWNYRRVATDGQCLFLMLWSWSIHETNLLLCERRYTVSAGKVFSDARQKEGFGRSMSRSMVVVKGTKKGQLEALLEQCVQLNADVRPNIEQGYFTVTVPPPWNISAQLVAQACTDCP